MTLRRTDGRPADPGRPQHQEKKDMAFAEFKLGRAGNPKDGLWACYQKGGAWIMSPEALRALGEGVERVRLLIDVAAGEVAFAALEPGDDRGVPLQRKARIKSGPVGVVHARALADAIGLPRAKSGRLAAREDEVDGQVWIIIKAIADQPPGRIADGYDF